MDGWPPSWRSLAWFSLARDVAEDGLRWAWRQVFRHDPNRRH